MRFGDIGKRALMFAVGLAVAGPLRADTPQSAVNEATIGTLIDQRRLNEAIAKIDTLVEQRLPDKEATKPDPVLDRVVGEITAERFPGAARSMLQRAVSDPATRDRARYLLLLAAANGSVGDAVGAEKIYRSLLTQDSASPKQKMRATIGLAQLLLPAAPEESAKILQSYLAGSSDPAARWEAELLAARAQRLLGKAAEAQALLETASQNAWKAPVEDMAVSRIALDRALVAGLAGDREVLVAMTATATDRQSFGDLAKLEALPLCGTGGVGEEDFVVLELLGKNSRQHANLIYASRPAIAPVFLRAYGRSATWVPNRRASSVLLRCSQAPTSQADSTNTDDQLIGWAANHGVYPPVGSDAAFQGSLPTRLAEREARYGHDSIMLFPVLAQMMAPNGGLFADAAGRERALDYAQRAASILARYGGSPAMRAPADLAALMIKVMMQRATPSETLDQAQHILADVVHDPAASPDMLLTLALTSGPFGTLSSDFRAKLLGDALTSLKGRLSKDDPRLLQLAVQLIQLRRDMGDVAGAAAVRKAYGLADDLCAVAESEPHYRSSDIRPEDYPVDALASLMFGRTKVEFSIEGSGDAKDVRILAEDPPFLFHDATVNRAPTIRYDPARRKGVPQTCRGAMQVVRWQMPIAFMGGFGD